MAKTQLTLTEAAALTRTGDLWLFRGNSIADRSIRFTTNSPVNHVGVAIVVDDLPPLMWHAELGQSLPDVWTGEHNRGAQLHDLVDAVTVWSNKYGQQGFLRQLFPPATEGMEDEALRTIARLNGTPFPSTAGMVGHWIKGRTRGVGERRLGKLEKAYCAEIVAVTYAAMGLLPAERSPSWYDPGRFWSGDGLQLLDGAQLGGEIRVDVPAPWETDPAPAAEGDGDIPKSNWFRRAMSWRPSWWQA